MTKAVDGPDGQGFGQVFGQGRMFFFAVTDSVRVLVTALSHPPDREPPRPHSGHPPQGDDMERRRCDQPRPAERLHTVRAEPPKVYTVKEVAELLKVSQGTVRNMIDEGQLYALRLHVRRLVVPKWA